MEAAQESRSPPAITFRPFEPSDSDLDAVMAFGSDDRVNRFVQFEPFASRDDAVRFVNDFILPHPWFRFICLAGGVRPVGVITLRPEDAGGGRIRVSVGFSVVPELWGRGIATAAVKMSLATAFGEWPEVVRVQAMAFVENLASQRVLEKAGFRREAVMRSYMISKGQIKDVVIYSLLYEDRM